MIFYYHTMHILIKALFFRFLSSHFWIFTFPIFFYTSSYTITFLSKCTKIFDELFNSLDFWFFLFIFSYSFRTLFIKTNSSWLITESINALEIKASIVINLNFANNTIFSCFFFFFFNYWLILFNSCSYCKHLWFIFRTCNSYRNTNWKSKSRYWNISSNCRSQNIIQIFRAVHTFLCFLLIKSFWWISSIK